MDKYLFKLHTETYLSRTSYETYYFLSLKSIMGNIFYFLYSTSFSPPTIRMPPAVRSFFTYAQRYIFQDHDISIGLGIINNKATAGQ